MGKNQAVANRNINTEEVRTLVLWERSHHLSQDMKGEAHHGFGSLIICLHRLFLLIVLVNIEKSVGQQTNLVTEDGFL